MAEGPPQAVAKTRAALLGTIERTDGLTQVTYAGWPLYTYRKDPAASLGGYGRESFGGAWYPLNPAGEVIR